MDGDTECSVYQCSSHRYSLSVLEYAQLHPTVPPFQAKMRKVREGTSEYLFLLCQLCWYGIQVTAERYQRATGDFLLEDGATIPAIVQVLRNTRNFAKDDMNSSGRNGEKKIADFACLSDILKQKTECECRCASLIWWHEKVPDPGNVISFVAARVFVVQTSMCVMETSVLLLAFKPTGFIFWQPLTRCDY